MTKINLSSLVKMGKNISVNHGSTILTAIGLVGMGIAIVESIKATPKAMEQIEEKKQQIYNTTDPIDIPMCASYHDVKLTKKEIIECTWKLYLKAAISGVVGASCIIASDKISLGRTAAAISMYDMAQNKLNEYKDTALKVVGEEKVQEIQKEVDKQYFKQDIVSNLKPINTGYGDTLCYDVIGERYFYSDLACIKMQLARITERMQSGAEEEPTLNELYAEMGLPGIIYGDILGWNVSHVRQIVLDDPYSKVREEDGKPYIVIDFGVRPNMEYRSAHLY